jgi:tRNA threonylcarbamoyladenosine biosynthesis protein TsaB
MWLLAVDTTTPWGSVAVLRDGSVEAELRLHEETHSRSLFGAVAHLLRGVGLGPKGLDAFAVAVGPGSFTGVRVGVSTVQGLALGSGRPALGLSSLLGLAGKMQGRAKWLVPMVDAYRGQVFAAVYDSDLRVRREGEAVAPEVVLPGLEGGSIAFLGDGVVRHRDMLKATRPDAIFCDRSFFLASTLGQLAFPRLARGEGGPPSALRPLYLRPPDIRVSSPRQVPP